MNIAPSRSPPERTDANAPSRLPVENIDSTNTVPIKHRGVTGDITRTATKKIPPISSARAQVSPIQPPVVPKNRSASEAGVSLTRGVDVVTISPALR